MKNASLYEIISHKKRYAPKLRRAAIQNMRPGDMKTLTRVMEGLLTDKWNVQLDPQTASKLRPYEKQYERFINSRKNLETQKKLLQRDQKGGMAILVPILGSVLATAAAEGVGQLVSAFKAKKAAKKKVEGAEK